MKTIINKTLTGVACDYFDEWAEKSNIPWVEVFSHEDFIAYVVDKDAIMSCPTLSPYLIELQTAFKNNPDFNSITLNLS